jgi:hypothetical protein
MKRLLIVAVSLSLGLGGLSGGVLAQTNSGLVVIDDASGTNGTNRLSGNCEMSGSGRDRLVTCTDLDPGQGTALSDPGTESAPLADPGTETAPVATEVAPDPAAPPDADSAPETTATATPTETDQDADNYADALEADAGLDPTTADTDADYVADGDEFNLYQTDPTVADTDGDGALDGEELFGRYTDPLLWDDGTISSSEPTTSSDAATEPAPASGAVETSTAAGSMDPVVADTATSEKEAAYAEGDAVSPSEGTTENLSASSTSLLGLDGTYHVMESSPPIISISGETTGVSVVLAPSLESAPAAGAEPTSVTETMESVETAVPVESAEPIAADTAGA